MESGALLARREWDYETPNLCFDDETKCSDDLVVGDGCASETGNVPTAM